LWVFVEDFGFDFVDVVFQVGYYGGVFIDDVV